MRRTLTALIALGALAACEGGTAMTTDDGGDDGDTVEPDLESVDLDPPTLDLGADVEGIHSVLCYTLSPEINAPGARAIEYLWEIIEFPESSVAARAFNEGAPQGPAPGIFCTNCICPAGQNTAAEPCLLTDAPGIWRVRLTLTVTQPCQSGICTFTIVDEMQITVPPALGIGLTWAPTALLDLHLTLLPDGTVKTDPTPWKDGFYDCTWDNPYPDWGSDRGEPGLVCESDPCVCAREGGEQGWCRRPAPMEPYACIDMRNDCNYIRDDWIGEEGGDVVLVNDPSPGTYRLAVSYTAGGSDGETHAAAVRVWWYDTMLTETVLSIAPGEIRIVGAIVVEAGMDGRTTATFLAEPISP